MDEYLRPRQANIGTTSASWSYDGNNLLSQALTIINSFMKTIYLIVLLFIVGIFTITSCNLAPGSYVYAEEYEIPCMEMDLIKVVKKFKADNPEYKVPIQTKIIDGRTISRDDHWYHVYFFYKKENQIIKTWIRQVNNETTTFAFVAINDGLKLGNWKGINKDFSRKENKMQKKKFEDLILNKITSQLK